MTEGRALLTGREVRERYAVSKSWLYEAMRQGDFPRPIKIGAQAVRWRVTDLEQWEASRPTADPDSARG